MRTVWLNMAKPKLVRPIPDAPLVFRAEFFDARGLRERDFSNYRDAFYFAQRKAGKAGVVIDGVPIEQRRMGGAA